jgi:hypothetical protein
MVIGNISNLFTITLSIYKKKNPKKSCYCCWIPRFFCSSGV